jgi:hypothetical protein
MSGRLYSLGEENRVVAARWAESSAASVMPQSILLVNPAYF